LQRSSERGQGPPSLQRTDGVSDFGTKIEKTLGNCGLEDTCASSQRDRKKTGALSMRSLYGKGIRAADVVS